MNEDELLADMAPQGDVSTRDISADLQVLSPEQFRTGYDYNFGYGGQSDTVIDTSQTNVDPNTAVNPNPGSVDLTDYNPTTVSQWWDTQQAVGGTPNFSTFPWGQAANAILGGSGGGMGAGLALGLGALAAALSRQQAPTIKQPEYKAAPVYDRALTAPIYPPQPAPQKSASGQNIYTPMRGMPLFFNPNPFQFDPTEAAKRYGPTPEQIAQGQARYEAGLAALYNQPISIAPITYAGANTVPAASAAKKSDNTIPYSPSDTLSLVPSSDEITGKTPYGGIAPSQGPPAMARGGFLKGQGGATGGAVDDIFVGFDGGQVGYNEGGMATGRYLSGGGDGMSDSIPATINNRQPARLADGEFVVPADVVADLGNGSSNAGAKKLYAMMKRIREARHGTNKQPPQVKAEKSMPA